MTRTAPANEPDGIELTGVPVGCQPLGGLVLAEDLTVRPLEANIRPEAQVSSGRQPRLIITR